MKIITRGSIVVAALLILSAALTGPTRASVLSGCVSPEDTGVTHLVGWVDVGVMLGMADPEPPASLQVTDPNGNVIDYRDGRGLIAPTEVLPIWFAPAQLGGEYRIVTNYQEECVVMVNSDQKDAPTDVNIIGWRVRSMPIDKP